MAENRVEANAHNAGGCPASNAIHGHINDFLVRTGLRSGVSELQLPCFTAVRAEIALMSGSAFAVTHHPVSSGAGRTSDGNGSHASTLKSPSYTKSVSWQHYRVDKQSSSFLSQEHRINGMIRIKMTKSLSFIQLSLTKFASGLVCSCQLTLFHQLLFVGPLYRPEPVPVLLQRFVGIPEASGFAATGSFEHWQAG